MAIEVVTELPGMMPGGRAEKWLVVARVEFPKLMTARMTDIGNYTTG
jgi:hypothetical protein